jgi:hypothetical protein
MPFKLPSRVLSMEKQAALKAPKQQSMYTYNGKSLFSLPNIKQGDMLITSWYGGVTVRELTPTVDEFIGLVVRDSDKDPLER